MCQSVAFSISHLYHLFKTYIDDTGSKGARKRQSVRATVVRRFREKQQGTMMLTLENENSN